ncbi:MAG: hypothetical protein HY043_08730 [Verrucomicrobia bacterium]|nr:hypothetical protein [Verrucomicrobiota bacterium]
MSEFQVIERVLEQTVRRRRWSRAWRSLWRGLLWGCVAWLVIIVAHKIFPLPDASVSFGFFVSFASALIGFFAGWWRKPSLAATARWIDDRQQLQERLSTALEVAPSATGNWRDLLLTDAAGHARKLDLKKLIPYGLPSACRWIVLLLVVGVGLGFVPEYRSKAYLQKKREAENIRETGKQMAELVRRNLDKRPPAMEPTRKSMESAAELGDLLTKAKLTRADALKDLASVTDKLQQQVKELTQNPALKRMEQAARTPGGNSESAAALQKKIQDLQKALGDKNGNPDALEKLKKDLQKLKEAASGMASQNSSKADAARDQLAKSLAALSQQAKDLGASLPSLEAAIEALQANQADMFLKEMNLAMQDLEKMKELAKNLQQMQQQADRLGKDLGEQLKFGQAEMAQATLQKMVEKLQSANLTPEELKKILEEVSKAVDPASPYGKVAELLKQGALQLQKAQKGDAAKSLAEAAKELKKLMDEMGDAQSLLATLDQLKQAQMCIGNCIGWGQCKRPGFNPNGRLPGYGVGTWSDSQGEWDGEQTQLWDNSNMNRPDMASKGLTDRGDAQLPDGLTPTKVRGQFTPGGSMPSITLKGVSIKGQSSVAYEQAAVAAQSDAQSALSQEQVPRAYQGAVRDYFDDLKK